MSLSSGTRLGPYEIVALIGVGGMGEVYRARDTKLNRDVALKVLPELVAADADRLARFEREAQLLAALNHPNVAGIYGVEDSSATRALVMELVEGPTLAEMLAGAGLSASGSGPAATSEAQSPKPKAGGLPLHDALNIARQLAEALEAAHEQGIIHRDLKPANIKVREDGTVKVLDFGLARLADPVGAGLYGGESALTMSPTITSPAMTQAGVILGTAAYMSPEQARGKAVDRRADIWAFGVVLYEVLTGRRAFEGDDLSITLAAVLKTDPDWTALPGDTPSTLRKLLGRCLQKDPKQRLQSIGDGRLEIGELLTGSPERDANATATTVPPVPLWRRLAVFSMPALLAGAAIAGGWVWFATRPVALHTSRLTMAIPGAAALTISANDRDLAITPDGTRVIYVGNNGTQLFVRALDALEPVVIATGTAGIRGPFVSPDSEWVGFVENNTTLKKVAITGGPPITLAQIDGVLSRGATWMPDDTIIFATTALTTGLQRVPAAGGTPEVLTRPDQARGEADHQWPELLPDGRAILFTITARTGGQDAAQIAVLDLRTGTQKALVRGGSDARYFSGHLVYTAGGTLRAVPFDVARLEVRGTAVPVVSHLFARGAGDFALATDGTLVYADGPDAGGAPARKLAWVDRTGKEEPIAAPPRAYVQPRLSPDGTRVAVYINDQENDIWIWDLRRTTLTRLTSEPGTDITPVWMPDGQRVVFGSDRTGVSNLWWQPADGTGVAERLTTSNNNQYAGGISPDGKRLTFQEVTPSMGRDLMELGLDGAGRVSPILQTRFEERNVEISPDGRWLVYESDSSGRLEIYVGPFPNTASRRWQVSTAGGTRPLWARSGKEIFYFAADGALMRVPVEVSGVAWNAGTPTKLLEPRYYTGAGNVGRTYDVSPDGQRFLMIKTPGSDPTAAPPSLIVVQHWDEELKRLVPVR